MEMERERNMRTTLRKGGGGDGGQAGPLGWKGKPRDRNRKWYQVNTEGKPKFRSGRTSQSILICSLNNTRSFFFVVWQRYDKTIISFCF
jgi:hypothetical protein